MYTATTNLIASAHEKERNKADKTRTRTVFITSLQLAVLVGVIFGFGLCSSASTLLKSLLGKGQGISPEVLSTAKKYVQIRALGMPAAVVIGSAQSACLGMKDTRSPLYVMLAAALVNLLGDIIFVPNGNPWIGGAAGAAWATVFSQYAALAMFLKWLKMKPVKDKSETDANNLKMDMGTKEESSTKSKSFSTRGILHGHFKSRDLLKLPSSFDTAKKFWSYVVPVTTTTIGRVSGYIAMSHVCSSALGTVDMAAQQIVLAFFLCFTPMCDSLNLAAQSFVPGIFEFEGDRRLRASALKRTVQNFVKTGCIFGAVLTGVVSCMPLVSGFFTRDPLVAASANSATPFLAVIFAMSGIVCAGEGKCERSA
jgi:Na+-driven multidrug efflux pump